MLIGREVTSVRELNKEAEKGNFAYENLGNVPKQAVHLQR
jgi:hypothetical protein